VGKRFPKVGRGSFFETFTNGLLGFPKLQLGIRGIYGGKTIMEKA